VSVSAAVVRDRGLSATSVGEATVSGDIGRQIPVEAGINGAASVSAAVVPDRARTASALGTASVTTSVETTPSGQRVIGVGAIPLPFFFEQDVVLDVHPILAGATV